MKTPTDNDELLADVLADDTDLRTSTLQAGLATVRRRRRARRVRTATLVLAPLLAIAALVFQRLHQPRPGPEKILSAAQPAPTVEGTDIRILTDEELLALFKGRPVALIGSPGHQQLILFDEMQK
jgi:hypothetical protein